MNFSEGFRESFDMIRHNKLRTVLTMLGMNIGVAAVIAVLAVGLMGRGAVMSGVESIGAKLMWIQPNWEAYPEGSTPIYMKPDDLDAIDSLAEGALVSPVLNRSYSIAYRGFESRNRVYGVRANYFEIWDFSMAKGRLFSGADMRDRNKVIVLGSNAARLFFGLDEEPVGKTIIVGSTGFTVIGVLEERGRRSISDGSDDDSCFVPYQTLEGIYNFSSQGGKRVFLVFIKVPDIPALDSISRLIGRYLETRYGSADGKPRFTIHKADDSISTFNSIFGIITTVISLIAGISLVVSGIGIMNIMLVAVTERTREIGIRKAIGAKKSDILVQFMIEAVIICLIGGGIGIILGIVVSLAVSAMQGWVYVMPVFGMILGIFVSIGIGLFFGIYPAMKAASLDPVVALMKE